MLKDGLKPLMQEIQNAVQDCCKEIAGECNHEDAQDCCKETEGECSHQATKECCKDSTTVKAE